MITKSKSYDVAIIGGGIGGLLTAYQIVEKCPNKKIVLFEGGRPLLERQCPMIAHKSDKCLCCKPCAIMNGMAGAGAFSDGKYILGTEYGGWLTDFVEKTVAQNYIDLANSILEKFGATKQVYCPNNDLKKMCEKFDLQMLQTKLKHLGTDENFNTMVKLIDYLKEKIEIHTLTTVNDVDIATHTLTFLKANKSDSIIAENIVFAVGRVGSQMFSDWCNKNNICVTSNQVDLGVRVELPRKVWKSFAEKIYEPKIVYKSKGYGDLTRMFCFNDGGQVIVENTDGIFTVNGHAYRNEDKKTENSNFALLSTVIFTEPFNEPIQYAKQVAKLCNTIGGGSVIVQRFGDLIKGRRSTKVRMQECKTKPTLKTIAGDLSLCIPKRQLDNIIETIYALDKVAPGTASGDTLLYGIECKYYSARPKLNNFEIVDTKNIYAVGDGVGITRSLSQAGANGLIVGDIICRKN